MGLGVGIGVGINFGMTVGISFGLSVGLRVGISVGVRVGMSCGDGVEKQLLNAHSSLHTYFTHSRGGTQSGVSQAHPDPGRRGARAG